MEEKTKYIIDTNVFIALAYEKDSLHKEALFVAEEFSCKDILLPYCILEETCTLLTYRFGKQASLNFLQDVEESETIHLIESDLNLEIPFFKNIKQKVSFTDSSLICFALKHNATLISFDKQLVNIYKKYTHTT